MGIHIHIHHHPDRETKEYHNLIINKLTTMGVQLDEIKAELVAAGVKADKIQADVTKLTNAIGNTGETPTAEEWAAVKTIAKDLNSNLQGIDDQTEDETQPEG